jgi:DNA-binding transcriptional ArsR family regulator
MDDIYKALADPTRRKILELLRAGDKNAGQISGQFNVTNASISHHLSILKNAGLVQSEKRGQFIIYSLNTTVFQDVFLWLQGLRDGRSEE